MTFTVLVTRPAHQSQALIDAIQARGWTALSLPLFEIRPVLDEAAARARLEALRQADWWLFTSVNAVERARQLVDPAQWPRLAAIGAPTAAALAELGHANVLAPAEDHTSEALLALPEFNAVENQQIVLVVGEGGRETLEINLRDRGARVERVAVYRREPTQPDAAEAGRALLAADAVVLTSGAAVERIKDVVPGAQRERLLGLPLVLPSQRVADLARGEGFTGPVALSRPMSDEAVVEALADFAAQRPVAPAAAPAVARDEVSAAVAPPATGRAQKAGKAAKADAPPPRPPATGRRSGLGLVWFVLLLLLAAAAAGGWFGWQLWQQVTTQQAGAVTEAATVREAMTELQRRFERLKRDQADLEFGARRTHTELGLLRERQEAFDEAVARLNDSVTGGRIDLQLAAVEQLLVYANERLQVGRDVEAAARALELADRRLSRLAEPRLFAIREAIAEERSRLAEVPAADTTALALGVSTLINRVERLPLRTHVPSRHGDEPEAPAAEDGASGSRRLLHAVKVALSSVFSLRRTDGPVRPLLTPEAEGLLRAVLTLRLEAARVALLSRDGAAFREALDDSAEWLSAHFDADDNAVAGAQREISRLRRADLSPALPDISGSLQLLRGTLDAPRDGQP